MYVVYYRWDMQRIREQKIYDKLNQHQSKDNVVPSAAASTSSSTTENEEPLTFYPRLSDSMYKICSSYTA